MKTTLYALCEFEKLRYAKSRIFEKQGCTKLKRSKSYNVVNKDLTIIAKSIQCHLIQFIIDAVFSSQVNVIKIVFNV